MSNSRMKWAFVLSLLSAAASAFSLIMSAQAYMFLQAHEQTQRIGQTLDDSLAAFASKVPNSHGDVAVIVNEVRVHHERTTGIRKDAQTLAQQIQYREIYSLVAWVVVFAISLLLMFISRGNSHQRT